MEINNIIVQAGGRGSRLETLTINKPKCLVPVDNLPMIFHLFKRFPKTRFIIIADYKSDVLINYLKAFAEVEYEVIVTNEKGTCSGIREALQHIPQQDPFILTWCDLVLNPDLSLPTDFSTNYVGISESFECRWSYENGSFIKKASSNNGVAGFFVFKDKSQLSEIQTSGEFVAWLSSQSIQFSRYSIRGSREIGTVLSYYQSKINKPNCRPFNQVMFKEDVVEKRPLDEQGQKLAVMESEWYKKATELNFSRLPEIYELSPLKMKRIQGKNIYEYNTLTYSQKVEIIKKIILGLKELHTLTTPIAANIDDCKTNYLTKTFERLDRVKNLVPFGDSEFITINGKRCLNVFFYQKELNEMLFNSFPKEFNFIHGDPTFSNIMLETESVEPFFIDPRGYFGNTKYFGDKNYDWAKLYYSIVGNYDQFNLKNFSLEITDTEVKLKILSSNWEDVEEIFFEETNADKKTIRLIHSIIWLSLTTYAWEDYDSICGAFYNGLLHLNEIINEK